MLFDLDKTQDLVERIVKAQDPKKEALNLLPTGEFPKFYDSINENIDSIQLDPSLWGKLTSIFPTKIFERNGGPLADKRPVLSDAEQFVTIYCKPGFNLSTEEVFEFEKLLGRDVAEGQYGNNTYYNVYTADPAILQKAKEYIGEENIQEVSEPEEQVLQSIREDRVRDEIRAALQKRKVEARLSELEIDVEPNSISIRAPNPNDFIYVADTTVDELLTNPELAEELDRAVNSVEDSLHDRWMVNHGMTWVDPGEIGALTEAPMFGEIDRDDNGYIMEVTNLYWYPDYMITDWRKRILEGETVKFVKLQEEKKEESQASVVRSSAFVFEDQPTQILALEEFFQWMYEGRVENDANDSDYNPDMVGQDVEDQLTGVSGDVNGQDVQDIFKTLTQGLSEEQIKEAAASVDAIDYITEGWAYYDGAQYKADVEKEKADKAEGYVASAGFFEDSEKMALENDFNGKVASLKANLPALYRAMLSGESADSYWGGINEVEELQTSDGKKVYFIETPGHGFYHDESGKYIGEEDGGFDGDWSQYNDERQEMHNKAKIVATGEPDQDYAHEDFDRICAALKAAGFTCKHKEFDKYQGVYIDASKAGKTIRYWVADYFTAGEVKKNPEVKWRSAILIDADGDQFSASRGDYFQLDDEETIDDVTLVLVDMNGEETRIENPRKADLPDLNEVQNTLQYEGEPNHVYGFMREGAPEGSEVYVTLFSDGNIDADELVTDAEAAIKDEPATEAALSSTPKKVNNTSGGNCDNCGKDLGASKWVYYESTGCSKKCAEEDHAADKMEMDMTESGLTAKLKAFPTLAKIIKRKVQADAGKRFNDKLNQNIGTDDAVVEKAEKAANQGNRYDRLIGIGEAIGPEEAKFVQHIRNLQSLQEWAGHLPKGMDILVDELGGGLLFRLVEKHGWDKEQIKRVVWGLPLDYLKMWGLDDLRVDKSEPIQHSVKNK